MSGTSSDQIRQSFLDYFGEQGHRIVPSYSVIPSNDPTLMFVNAGMVPFKDVFTGRDKRDYKRATTSQKCIRISGKHNDLENVGVTARHQTFFEMLGNFSFGDYFKEEAIKYGWDFLTKVMGLSTDKLVVTVFGGEGDLAADVEAKELWRKISGLPEARIQECGAADNFWSMGPTGPCGPCAEVHYYIGEGDPDPKLFGAEPTIDGKGWTEIWNLVFMQFDRQADGTMVPLPKPSIDTGMGLERLSVLMQGVTSNYDTDLLRPFVDLASEISGKPYAGSLAPDDVSMRVIADHARTTAFLIAEGVFPDKGEREYVLRRVMRRAIRHGERLGIHEPFLHRVASHVADKMGGAYPELAERRELIESISLQEEERFRRTLARGLELLEKNDEWIERDGRKVLPGKVVFGLYDRDGFPLDLTEVIGRENDFDIDHDGFQTLLEEQRTRSRGSKLGSAAVLDVHHELASNNAAVEFTGYEAEVGTSEVFGIVHEGNAVNTLNKGQTGEVLSRATPFYGESGGQVGDQGTIEVPGGLFRVHDTQKPAPGLIVHRGEMETGTLSVADKATLTVDGARRTRIRRNHTATHLLHYALRTVLGPTAIQKGSLVGPDRLRFDYASPRAMTLAEQERVEDLVNEKILANAPVTTDVLPMDEAKARGAIGIFEEKYGAVVRMLTMTSDSIELCGGTHAIRTGDLGLFKIMSEGGLAAGVRRIEGATGENVVAWMRALESEVRATTQLLKAPPLRPLGKVKRLVEQQKEHAKEIDRLKAKLAGGGGGRDLLADATDVDGIRVLGVKVELGDPKTLRALADKLRDQLAPAAVLVGTEAKGGKALLACSVSKEATKQFHAGNIVKRAAQIVGGGGGGRPDFAQAGGSDATKLDEAVRSIY